VKKNDAYYYTILKLVLVIVVVSLLQNVARLNRLVYNKYTNHYGQLETMYVDQHQTHSKRDISGSGLRAIITGLEHSGSTKVGRILASAPCIIGAYETGYLLAPTPQDIDSILPWFDWNSATSNMTIENYRLQPDDIKAMKNIQNSTNFLDMYNVLRHRSYLFNKLNSDEECSKPSYMFDSTPRYVYPEYFEKVLAKTPGVPVIVTMTNYDDLNALWRRYSGNSIPHEEYDLTTQTVYEMKKKFPGRILIVNDLVEFTESKMVDVFHHIGLEWKSEYLSMKGLLDKFAKEPLVVKEIQRWITDDAIGTGIDHSRCPEADDNGKRKIYYYTEDVKHSKNKYLEHCSKKNGSDISKCIGLVRTLIEHTMLLTRKEREILGKIDVDKQLQHLAFAEKFGKKYIGVHDEDDNEIDPLFSTLIVELYNEMGILEKRRDNLSEALKYFKSTLKINPSSREASWHLSQFPNMVKDQRISTIKEQIDEKNDRSNTPSGKAVLCVIAMDETPYIDEFVDYHLGIGFGKIIIYDNTEKHQLKQWKQKREGDRVAVIHYPGMGKQGDAYLDCAKNTLDGKHGKDKLWAAFWDVDEFIVLNKHDTIDALLEEHVESGSLGVNWYMFGPSGKTTYEPLPVTKRFVYRDREVNMHIKSIVKLSDMNMTEPPHVHYPTLPMLNGNQHDTNGKVFMGAFNVGGPTDVAVLHHYMTKSFGEYKDKRIRGRADLPDGTALNPGFEYKLQVKQATADYEDALLNNGNICRKIDERVSGQIPATFDDSAWVLLTRNVPKYALYDSDWDI